MLKETWDKITAIFGVFALTFQVSIVALMGIIVYNSGKITDGILSSYVNVSRKEVGELLTINGTLLSYSYFLLYFMVAFIVLFIFFRIHGFLKNNSVRKVEK